MSQQSSDLVPVTARFPRRMFEQLRTLAATECRSLGSQTVYLCSQVLSSSGAGTRRLADTSADVKTAILNVVEGEGGDDGRCQNRRA